MTKRILDLAKELGLEAADIQRLAVQCSVMVSGPTSTLDADDQDKIRAAAKAAAKPDAGKSGGGKTLTLNRPMLAGQSRSGARVEGRGRTVEVAVRRRHAAPGKPMKAPVETVERPVASVDKVAAKGTKSTPAQRAAAALEIKKQQALKKPETKAVSAKVSTQLFRKSTVTYNW